MRKHLFVAAALTGLQWCVAAPASAAPVGEPPVAVTYTVTGSPGQWLLNFSFTHQLPGAPDDMAIYFLGVERNELAGTPSGFEPYQGPLPWSNAEYGGMGSYDVAWSRTESGQGLLPGETASGFVALSLEQVAPTSMPWFAWAYSPSGAQYHGGGQFSYGIPGNTPPFSNPGFEGVAIAVPEPETMGLLLLGLAAIAGRARSRMGRDSA
ncbi:PEP-CTERM sorting domain-containing protein [Caldimonas brevitalea]|nr:PEP-CTERM sorting domain-containing protein [Caldimonas brevitalea]